MNEKNSVRFVGEGSKCKNCPHLKYIHESTNGMAVLTCGNFEFEDNLQYLEYQLQLKEKRVKTYWDRLCNYCPIFRIFKLSKTD